MAEVAIMLSGSIDIVLACLATVVFVEYATNATTAAMAMASRVRMDDLLCESRDLSGIGQELLLFVVVTVSASSNPGCVGQHKKA